MADWDLLRERVQQALASTGYKGGKLTPTQAAAATEAAGMPGITMSQVMRGESGFDPKAVGDDAKAGYGNTFGLGLGQITTKYNDDVINFFGGRDAMMDPVTNILAMKMVYDRQGIKAWYGTRYVTDKDAHYKGGDLGGDVPTAGKGNTASNFNLGGSQTPVAPKANPFTTIASLSQNQSGPFADTMNRGWDLLGQLWQQKYGQQAAPTSLASVTKMGGTGGSVDQTAGAGGGLSGLREAFYDPVGGYDNGTSIGPIGGHSDHQHFGGGPKTIARIIKLAQERGLTVRENNAVDPVDPVHVQNSWHYRFGGRGGADISGPDMEGFFRDVLRRAGWPRK